MQNMTWAVDLMERGYNPARHIKGGDAVLNDGEYPRPRTTDGPPWRPRGGPLCSLA
ncbi:hypothetical protein [Streptomyces humi]